MKIKELLKPSEDRIEQLIKTEERLRIVKDYVVNTTYLDKSLLLVLLGENNQKADAE